MKVKRIKTLRLLIFVWIFIGMLSFNVKSVFADENKWVEKRAEELQMPDKVWDIILTTEVDEDTINSENIYVRDFDGDYFEDIEFTYIKNEDEEESDDESHQSIIRVKPTKEYKQGETYYLYVDKDLKSAKGTPVLEPYRLEFKIKEIDLDFFKIRNVTPVSNNLLNIHFTQPIGEDALYASNYVILEDGQIFADGREVGVNIRPIHGNNNGVSIFLKNKELDPDYEYTLKIYGHIKSKYGCELGNGLGDEVNFFAIEAENEDIKVTDVQAVSQKDIRVTFNKTVDKQFATLLNNYLLKDNNGVPRGISRVEVSDDYKSVNLSVSGGLKESVEYTLNIRGIRDEFGLTGLQDERYEVVYEKSNDNLEIERVLALNERTIQVSFNNKLDKDKADRTSYYKIRGVDDSRYRAYVRKAYYNEEEPDKVILYLSKDLDDEEYRLTLSSSLKDEFGNSASRDEDYEFYGSDLEYVGAYVDRAVIIDKNYIKLTFISPIKDSGNNLEVSNYSLESIYGTSKLMIECSEVRLVDEKTLILNFENINFDENYILKINSLNDILGETNEKYKENGIGVALGRGANNEIEE
jgi:hypothetical protein